MEQLTDEKIADLKAAGAQVLCEHEGRQFAFRKPSEAQWMVCMSDMENSSRSSHIAQKAMITECAVYPDRADLASFLRENPPLVQAFWGDIVENCGLKDRTTAKKL